MSCQLGLSVGESFAELTSSSSVDDASDAKSASVQTRWYLAKKTLADGIKEAFAELGVDAESAGGERGPVELHIATGVVERSLARGQGQSPALLVATGFETLYKMRQPLLTAPFSIEPKRKTPLVESDFIFGISARMRADGTEEVAVSQEELEFLQAKLELLKVHSVVVALPHADKNSEHEDKVAEFFREHGFKAFASHTLSASSDPVARWIEVSELAFAELAVEEEREQIEAALEEVAPGNWEIMEWTLPGHGVRGGLEAALQNALPVKAEPTLHLGLDEFYLLQEEGSRALNLSPSQALKMGEWGFPSTGNEAIGLEPGPMLFGKSQQLSILDILYVLGRLDPITGLTPLINEKSNSRITETLLAWGKSAGLAENIIRLDALQVAEDIEAGFVERLAHKALNGVKGRLVLQGPMASTMFTLLKKRRPDLTLVLSPTAEWSESRACLEMTK